MAASEDLIDFNVIESHKENIQALPSGRSAKALAQIFSPPLLGANPSPAATQDANSEKRKEYEKELQSIDEADDPLDVYDRYVKWTMDSYPSSQATPQSQLLPLLERATKAFQSSSHYKNDPRYLKLWLHYIRLFSDAPREIFVFLARHGIGEGLALYYEEFAAWLENAGRWTQAEEIYKMGLEKEARPTERLLRKFGEFERRNQARPQDVAEPTSPALPMARPALAAKIDPFAAPSPSTAQPQQSRSTTSKKPKGSKMAIFSDSDDSSSRPNSGSGSKGWDNIGTLADRKKENTVEAKPWAGEKLKGGKTNGGMQKMMVFKDQSSSHRATSSAALPRHLSSSEFSAQTSASRSAHDQQCVMNPKTGRLECVFVNLEAVYPDPARMSVEYCFEELRARHRGYKMANLRKMRREEQQSEECMPRETVEETDAVTQDSQEDSTTGIAQVEVRTTKKERGFKIFEDALDLEPAVPPAFVDEKVLVETLSQTLALNDEQDENAPPSRQDVDLAKQLRREQRREERANRTRKIKVMDVKHINNETKTIQLNLDSPTGPKLKRKKSGDRPEPTMTINTKEAMDEIYGIFNQPLPSQGEQTDGEDEDSEDDYTTGDESTGTGKLSAPTSEYGDDTRNELLGVQKPLSDEEGRTDGSKWSDFTTSKHVPKDAAMDSIVESTQSTTWEVFQDQTQSEGATLPDDEVEELVTPQDEEPRTRYVPVPPEGYEHRTGQYRDVAVVANNRLPFMTPIVEQTESSLGLATGRTEKDYFNSSKTPSRRTGVPAPPLPEDEPLSSSPFQELIADNAEDRRKVLQPIRTKSTKGTISLGQGTAQAQIAAKSMKATVVAEPVQKGPVIKDEQCNPMDPQLRETILSQMKPGLATFEGYHEHLDMTSGRTAEIKKYIRVLQKANRSSVNPDKTASTLSLPPMLHFPGGHGTYTIKRELGAGTFAPVYLVENSTAISSEETDETDENHPRVLGKSTHRKPLEAIKMEEPASVWEFYILRQTHRRLGVHRASQSIVRAHEMHLFRDECFLVEEYRSQGTLLDLVNIARLEAANTNAGGGVEEMLAMWLTVELLRTLEALHAKQIIHGDLKGDNVLVRFDDPGQETDWSPTFFPSGAHGWASKGICLIDMGRGIDMKQFVPGVGFIADWKTTDADCAEMRELRPWTYQVDYYGVAGIIHSLLFGRYMETVGEKAGTAMLGPAAQTKTYRIREGLKRYWQTEIWGEVFALLLNPLAHVEGEEGGKMPVLKGMRGCRERMEGWLEENCERGVGLKGMIGRMEGVIRERRRKSGKV